MLVDLELQEPENRRLQRALKAAKLRANAVIEDVDFRRRRGLERAQVLELAQSHWVQNRHNLLIVGPTGGGKTYLACALRACSRISPSPAPTAAWHACSPAGRASTSSSSTISCSRPLTPDQAAHLLEVIEDRSQLRSTIVTSQLPVAHGTRHSARRPSPTPSSTASYPEFGIRGVIPPSPLCRIALGMSSVETIRSG